MRQIKSTILTLLLGTLMVVCTSMHVNATNANNSINVENTLVNKGWDSIMNAIIQIESGGDKNAKNGNSLGILQITPAVVKACNNIMKEQGKSKRYTLSDRTSVKKSKEMFIIYQNKYNKEMSPRKACKIWKNGPFSRTSSSIYWKKFLKYYKK